MRNGSTSSSVIMATGTTATKFVNRADASSFGSSIIVGQVLRIVHNSTVDFSSSPTFIVG
jgi:hypothetical protein